jgi:hypothetical protein
MGITVKSYGTIPVDRSVGRLEFFTESDNRDDWRIVIHWQDAPYESEEKGAKRLDDPKFGTARTDVRYGDIKDMATANGKVSDLFDPIRALCYALLQARMQPVVQPVVTP